MSTTDATAQSRTEHLLPLERRKASFDVLALTHVIDGGPDATKHRRWLWSAASMHDNSSNTNLSRSALGAHVSRAVTTSLVPLTCVP